MSVQIERMLLRLDLYIYIIIEFWIVQSFLTLLENLQFATSNIILCISLGSIIQIVSNL